MLLTSFIFIDEWTEEKYRFRFGFITPLLFSQL